MFPRGPQAASGGSRTAAGYSFSNVPAPQIQRSVFDRSHGVKTAFDGGYLVPFFVDEALPGDTHSISMNVFGRLQPTVDIPIDNLWLEFFFFSCPVRILWDNWEKFNGAQDDPGDSISFTVPQMTQNPTVGSLSDYMGLPIGNSITFNSLHHRCYNRVFNDWFRDQDLTDSAVVDTDDGPDTAGDYVLRRRAKRHDYFTACRPATQKGTAVTLGIGSTAPVVSAGTDIPTFDSTGGGTGNKALKVEGVADNVEVDDGMLSGSLSWNTTSLEADLSSATANTINDIRLAFQTQKVLERDQRGGTRYNEVIRAHFNVIHPDQSWRSEFLGGGRTRITFNTISRTDGFIGQLSSIPVFSNQGRIGFTKSFTEHQVIIGLVNVRADLTYQYGVPRMFNRQTRYDFFLPAFAHLGEQAVLNQEIYADGSANDTLVFGYQERWAEYRHKPSMITGQLRSSASTPLDTWHYGLKFTTLPALNNTFIEDNPPIERTVSITTEPEIFMDAYLNYRCARPMPTYSVPGQVDRF